MATPVYIIACEGVVQDSTTNLMSYYNVAERLILTVVPRTNDDEHPARVGSIRLGIVAVWMKEEGDEEKRFQSRLLFTRPNGKEVSIEEALLEFDFKNKKNLQRLKYHIEGTPPFGLEPGIVWAVSQIRELDSKTWQQQKYPIFYAVREAEPDVLQGAEVAAQKGRDV